MSIKIKLKPCAGEDCNGKLQKIWKQHEGKRYCQSCWAKIKPAAPLKQTPLPKSQKPISKESSKRKKEHALYSVMRVQFLKDHPMCFMAIPGICTNNATEIQHLKGRGIYYLDTTTWGAACHCCHQYATDHPQEAIENGWAVLRLTEK